MTIAEAFAATRKRGELALIPYLTAGFPSRSAFSDALSEVVAGGADIVEIGIPFSDPIADGPTIQRSSQAALAAGISLETTFEILSVTPRSAVPLVFMSYLNPLLAFGRERLLDAMAEVGVEGLIVPDLPVDEAEEWCDAAAARGCSVVFLAAPTNTPERLRKIGERTRGFLYAVSLLGTTGARRELPPHLPAFLQRVRGCTEQPIAVGFGISTPAHVMQLAGLADGVVVGSRLVEAIECGEDLTKCVAELKRATGGGG